MAGTLRTFLTGISVLLMTACASNIDRNNWPSELPPISFFQQQWLLDADNQQEQSEANYVLWVERFYNGFQIVPGWLDMMAEVDARIDETDRQPVKEKLYELGRRIGAEWAKHDDYRKLDSRCAAVWRDALIESLAQDDLYPYLDRLTQDVEALFTGDLVMDDIYFERYYVDEFDF